MERVLYDRSGKPHFLRQTLLPQPSPPPLLIEDHHDDEPEEDELPGTGPRRESRRQLSQKKQLERAQLTEKEKSDRLGRRAALVRALRKDSDPNPAD